MLLLRPIKGGGGICVWIFVKSFDFKVTSSASTSQLGVWSLSGFSPVFIATDVLER